jgi:hypothetical protein
MSFAWSDLPPFVGQRVVIDPSTESGQKYQRQSGGEAGTITYAETNLKRYLTRDDVNKSDIYVKVVWDNGHTNIYRLKFLIPIEGKHEDMIFVCFDGDRTKMDTLEEAQGLLDELIIIDEIPDARIEVIDEKYRSEMFQKMAKVLQESGTETSVRKKVVRKRPEAPDDEVNWWS